MSHEVDEKENIKNPTAGLIFFFHNPHNDMSMNKGHSRPRRSYDYEDMSGCISPPRSDVDLHPPDT